MAGDADSLRRRAVALSSSGIGDAFGKKGHLPAALRRVHGDGVFAGPARTAACAEGSSASLLQVLLSAGPGDVLLVRGPGEYAYVGELLAAEAARRGVVAIVVDGLVRDLPRMVELDLAVCATGLTPRGAKLGDYGESEVRMSFGETEVGPGDWLIGDADGVVAVPLDQLDAVLERAAEIEAEESEVWEKLRAGTPMRDLPGAYGEAIRSVEERGPSRPDDDVS